jgi:short-chain Z-isoprenyl diphosphate synthase
VTSRRIPRPGPGFLYGLYQNRLRRSLDPASVPQHVAMIIDGNRRWARQLGLETVAHGHRAGAAKMLEFDLPQEAVEPVGEELTAGGSATSAA